MNLYNISLFTYSALLIIGGYFGHRAGSAISLVTSVTAGLSLFLLWFLSQQGQTWGDLAIAIVLALLGIFFAYRFGSTGKFMPGGLMFILTLIMLVIAFMKSRT
jgi:uncharacterized membrane protein (UPF0136 family)